MQKTFIICLFFLAPSLLEASELKSSSMFFGIFDFSIPYVDESVPYDGYEDKSQWPPLIAKRNKQLDFIGIYTPEIQYRAFGPHSGWLFCSSINLDLIVLSDSSEFMGYAGPGVGFDFNVNRETYAIGGDIHYVYKIISGLYNLDYGIRFLKYSDYKNLDSSLELQLFGTFIDLGLCWGFNFAPSGLSQSLAFSFRL